MKDNYICPHCGTEQDRVIQDRVQHSYYDVYPEGNNLDYNHDSDGDVESEAFYCPECDSKLADNEDQVLRLFGAEFFYVCHDQLTNLGLKTTTILSFTNKEDALRFMNNMDIKNREVNADENLRVLSSEEYINVLAKECQISKSDDGVLHGKKENLKEFLDRISNL